MSVQQQNTLCIQRTETSRQDRDRACCADPANKWRQSKQKCH